jgi:transposase
MSGRNTICTPELIKTVSDNITLGLSNADAAALAGIGESTFYAWRARGEAEIERVDSNPRASIRKEEVPFVEFVEAIKKAVPRRKQVLIGRIQKAAQSDQWQAAAWLLERLHNEEFGRRQVVEFKEWKIAAQQAGLQPEEVEQIFEADVEAAINQLFKGKNADT